MLLCAVAIHADTAPTLAWILLGLNAVGAALVSLALWIGDLPEDRKPFGPFTDVAECRRIPAPPTNPSLSRRA